MNQKHLVLWTTAALALGAAGGAVWAAGVPSTSPLTYAGVVTDEDGEPYPTGVNVVVALYDGQNAPSPACTSPTAIAEAGTGRFEVVLPDACAQAVHDSDDVWVELTVGDPGTALPRTRVGAVPYALQADTASHAAGALKAELDGLKATGTELPSGYIKMRVVDADGQFVGDVPPAFLPTSSGPDVLLPNGSLLLSVNVTDGAHKGLKKLGFAGYTGQIDFTGPDCTGTAYSTDTNLQNMCDSAIPAVRFVGAGFISTSDHCPLKPLPLTGVTFNSQLTCLNDDSAGCTCKNVSEPALSSAKYYELTIKQADQAGLPANHKLPFKLEVVQ